MKLFAQIRKVDEAKRLVFGRAAEEVVDKADEIMDYASSKPFFEKWSQEIAKDTDGKSLGNVRAMHGKVAAGKLTGIDFNDAEKAIDICAKVVDDAEWKKVLEGVYTGFSVGGAYVDGSKKVEKLDDKQVTRYTAAPSEISLVDRPCIPTAKFFEVQKADGTLSKVDFQAPPSDPDDAELIVNGSADEVAALAKLMNDKGLSMADVLVKLAEPAAAAPAPAAAAAAPAAPAEPVQKLDAGALRKSMYSCSYMAEAIASLMSLKTSAEYEAFYEGDSSGIAAKLGACIAMCGQVLIEMIQEEVTEAAANATAGADTSLVVELSTKAGNLAKFDGDPVLALLKVGARNSAADKERLGKIHDLAVELGHDCAAAKAAPGGDLAKGETLAKAEVEKLLGEAVEPLKKALEAANGEIAKLKEQPAPARVSLRAVAKGDDLDTNAPAAAAPPPVVDDRGEVRPIATLIKSIHQSGGAPLRAPLSK